MTINWPIWLAIVAVSLTGVLTRVSLLSLGDHIRLPSFVERALKFAAAVALASIATPAVLTSHGVPVFKFSPTLIAAMVTAGLMVWRKNMLLALVAGVAVYSVCHLWGGY